MSWLRKWMAVFSWLVLVVAIGCGSDKPPSEATIKELALLSKAGNAEATSELSKLESAIVPDGGDVGATNTSPPPPDAVAAELARLANSGDASATAAMKDINELSKQYEERDTAAKREMDTAALLARLSATDDAESERRADAAAELRTRFDNRELDSGRALDLLDTIAPGASINDRREAADKLARLSAASGDWNAEQRTEAANELFRLITGNEPDAERRVEAAREMATRFDKGDLEAKDALELMERISPGTAIKTRAEALGSIAARFGEGGDWGHEDARGFADDLNRLAFGDELNLEKRGRAAVDLASEGVKFIGGDSYDDDERKALDDSGRLIKEAIFGDSQSLSDTVSDILGD